MKAHHSVMSEDQSRELRSAIRRAFLDVWDPIRISDEPDAQDEYDGYIGPVFELLTRGGSDKQIMDHLAWAVNRMGMDASRVSLQTVIEALRAIEWDGKPCAK